MSGSFSLTDFIKQKPQKKKNGGGGGGGHPQNLNKNSHASHASHVSPASHVSHASPAIFQMENDMRKLLHQLLEKMYGGRRLNDIVDELISQMRNNAADFVNIFTNYRVFYDHIARVDSSI